MNTSDSKNYTILVIQTEEGYSWRLETLGREIIAMSHGLAFDCSISAFSAAKAWVKAHEDMGYEIRPQWWEPKQDLTPENVMNFDNLSCLAKKDHDEPMFIILGRDPDGGNIVRMWGNRRIEAGDVEHGNKALIIADMMDKWAETHKPRTAPQKQAYPDLPETHPNDASTLNEKIFTLGLTVKGDFHASYCFESMKDRETWIIEEMPKLSEKYKNLEVDSYSLPGLKVGENCRVSGEGSDVFRIEGIVEYSPHRYGFILDSGDTEAVNKCYKTGF